MIFGFGCPPLSFSLLSTHFLVGESVLNFLSGLRNLGEEGVDRFEVGFGMEDG